MDFADRIKQLSERIRGQLDHVDTEEATKNALIMPFIQALGYDVFNPQEVVPEFTADVGTKKGEKVDYAVMKDGRPIILFECKTAGLPLEDSHTSQLFRYFSVTDVRFAILTNGVQYRFYSDLDKENKMDSRPFLELDLLRLDTALLEELKKFEKASYDESRIIETASTLKYTREIKKILVEQLQEPDEEFVRLLGGRVYSGRFTQSALEQFTAIVLQAFRSFVNDRVNERLKSALSAGDEVPDVDFAESETAAEIETTEDEWRAYYMIQAILRDTVAPDRVVIRDAKSYCSVLLDDNNRKPICRLWLESKSKYIGLFDEEKNVTRHAIERIEDIYKYQAELAATAFRWNQSEGA